MVISRMNQKAELKSQDTNWSNHMLFSPYPILNAKNANRSIRKWPKSIGLIVYNVKNVRAFDARYIEWIENVMCCSLAVSNTMGLKTSSMKQIQFCLQLCCVPSREHEPSPFKSLLPRFTFFSLSIRTQRSVNGADGAVVVALPCYIDADAPVLFGVQC